MHGSTDQVNPFIELLLCFTPHELNSNSRLISKLRETSQLSLTLSPPLIKVSMLYISMLEPDLVYISYPLLKFTKLLYKGIQLFLSRYTFKNFS